MRSRTTLIDELKGLLLIAIACIATLWLGATGEINLYVHPRYITFCMVASAIGLTFVIVSFGAKLPRRSVFSLASTLTTLLLLIVAIFSLLVTEPTTLSSTIANQRGVNASASSDSLSKLSNVNTVSPFGVNNLELSIKEWSGLLTQINDEAFFKDRSATLEGFITRDESNSANTFYVSRFVLSCCAVDARPVGVPVYSPEWETTYKTDQWVRVEGVFGSVDGQRIQLKATKITPIAQPKEPYAY